MAGERRINWGADATDAQYRTGDDDANNRFILVEDLDGGTVLLERDESAGEFVYRGPVNMDGNDLSNVGALDATSVSTIQEIIGDDTNGNRAVLSTDRDAAPQELTLQPESDDVVGSILLLPSGTDDRSHVLVGNTSDANNMGYAKFEADGPDSGIWAGAKGTGNAPTTFDFRNFSQGIRLSDGSPGRDEYQGTPTDPTLETRFRGDTEQEFTGVYSASTVVTGDNTDHLIFEQQDPPYIGDITVYGMEDGNPDDNAFCDRIRKIRFHAIDSDKFGAVNAPTRSYSSGGGLNMSIDDSGTDYRVNVVYQGSQT